MDLCLPMGTDRPSLVERLVCALRSGNLKPSREHQADVDRIGAAGLASMSVPLAMSMFELKYRRSADGHLGTGSQLAPIIDELVRRLRRKARATREWRIRRGNDFDRAVLLALQWWMGATCQACNGRQYEVVPGTPMLSDRQCHSCGGVGKTAVRVMLRQEVGREAAEILADPVEWLAEHFTALETEAGDEYVRRLSRHFTFNSTEFDPWDVWG